MTRTRSLLSLLALAAIAGTLAWLLRPAPPPEREPLPRSDYILRDFEMTVLDADGGESFSLRGPLLERDPAGQHLTLTTPRFAFPDDEKGHWTATSASAWVSPKADEVRLLGQMEMLGPVLETGVRTRFATERLDVFPKLHRASTTEAVTVSQGDSILRATGLQVDMQTDRLHLLSDVKGRYAPARR